MDETPITYSQAAKLAGVSPETIRRWHVAGKRRPDGVKVKLRVVRHFGRRHTTRAWLNAFGMECNGGTESESLPPRQPQSMSLADRRKRARRLYGQQTKAVPDLRRSRQGARPLSNVLVSSVLPDSQETGRDGSAVSGVGAVTAPLHFSPI